MGAQVKPAWLCILLPCLLERSNRLLHFNSLNYAQSTLHCCCRDATAEHLAVQESKRQYIEARKAAELAGERTSLAAWRTGLPGGQEPAREPAAECRPQQTGYASAADQRAGNRAAQDHPAYYGRRTWPSTSVGGSAPGADALDSNGNSRTAAQADAIGAELYHGSVEGTGTGAALRGSQEADAAHARPPVACPSRRFKPPPPPRPAAARVLVEFTPLQTRHLPARASREADIRAYRQRQQVRPC